MMSTATPHASLLSAAVVHPLDVLANRSQLAWLAASDFFGFNIPAIAASESEYDACWAQDVTDTPEELRDGRHSTHERRGVINKIKQRLWRDPQHHGDHGADRNSGLAQHARHRDRRRFGR